MGYYSQNCDLVRFWAVRPQNAIGLWGLILNVGTKDLKAINIFKSSHRMRVQSRILWVARKMAKTFFQLLLETALSGIFHNFFNLGLSLSRHPQLKGRATHLSLIQSAGTFFVCPFLNSETDLLRLSKSSASTKETVF